MLTRAINCLYGAAIGDAFGARYEFNNDQFQTDQEKFDFIPLLGGGVWNLVPGQVTDDTEMSLALTHSLITTKTVNMGSIASQYHNWFLSKPFDIGRATLNSVQYPYQNLMLEAAKTFDNEAIKKYGSPNLSNGMLMRIHPLAVFLAGRISNSKMTDKEIAMFVRNAVLQDTPLTHSSEEASWFSTAYVTLLVTAILDGSLNRGVSIIQSEYHKYQKIGDWYQTLLNGIEPSSKLAHDPKQNIGDVRIAFQLAVRKAIFVMRKQMTYEEAILSTVNLGGDTDTNASIVGALCGAVCTDISDNWKKTLKECKSERYEQYKLDQYLTNLEEVAAALLDPTKN